MTATTPTKEALNNVNYGQLLLEMAQAGEPERITETVDCLVDAQINWVTRKTNAETKLSYEESQKDLGSVAYINFYVAEALNKAMVGNHKEVVQALMDSVQQYGLVYAVLNTTSERGNTPLLTACMNNSKEAAEAFLAPLGKLFATYPEKLPEGMDLKTYVNIVNDAHFTAMDYATYPQVKPVDVNAEAQDMQKKHKLFPRRARIAAQGVADMVAEQENRSYSLQPMLAQYGAIESDATINPAVIKQVLNDHHFNGVRPEYESTISYQKGASSVEIPVRIAPITIKKADLEVAEDINKQREMDASRSTKTFAQRKSSTGNVMQR